MQKNILEKKLKEKRLLLYHTSTTLNVKQQKTLAVSFGLEVERIVNRPTAAALAYGLDKVDPRRKKS